MTFHGPQALESSAMSGSEASSPDYEQDWDALERQSLEVLERSVQA